MSKQRNAIPRLPKNFLHRLDLSRAATPRLLKESPIHRWFYFPHSYSPQLVETILEKWKLPVGCELLDPFVGSGTTLLVAKEKGYNALGLDLSPLSVLVSNVKVGNHNRVVVLKALPRVLNAARSNTSSPANVIDRLSHAFTKMEYTWFWRLRQAIQQTDAVVRDLMLVGLIRIVPKFSRAVADGGWFRWIEKPDQADLVLPAFQSSVEYMLSEIMEGNGSANVRVSATCQDARKVHTLNYPFKGLITSPPYPNRHDYSRVFQIELLTMGQGEDDIFCMRHASLRSHVEARDPREAFVAEYQVPTKLQQCLNRMPADVDHRIPRMLKGYFEDMYLVLRAIKQRVQPGGQLAFVVGNVRHAGILIPVDEILAQIAESVDLRWVETWVIRLRGNSAQQMGEYGRVPSRESIVFLEWRG